MKLDRRIDIPAALFAAIILIAGCHSASSDRASRLASDENYRNKGQIESLNKQIAALTKDLQQCSSEKATLAAESQKQIAPRLESLTKELDDCRRELASPTDKRLKKMAAEMERTKKEVEETVNFAMTEGQKAVTDENKQLKGENEKLKAQIRNLEDQLKQKPAAANP